jgi:predicted methyltransferase
MFSKSMHRYALSVAFAAALPALASAQAVCGPRESIVSTLGDKYQESRQALGLVGQDGRGVMELFVSKKGSWTMLMTYAKGSTCIVAAGQAWEHTPGEVAGAGI